MQVKYSKHIETRISLRKIEYDLPCGTLGTFLTPLTKNLSPEGIAIVEGRAEVVKIWLETSSMYPATILSCSESLNE